MPEPQKNPEDAHLGELLVQRGIISEDQRNQALEEQRSSGRFFGTILVSNGWASEEDVARGLSEQVGLAYVDISSQPIDPNALNILSEEICRTHLALPLFSMGSSVTIAMANPLDEQALTELKKLTQQQIWPVFSTPTAIRNAIDKLTHKDEPKSEPIPEEPEQSPVEAPPVEKKQASGRPTDNKLKATSGFAHVVDLVHQIIQDAIAIKSSDIHLEPLKETFKCRFRVDGILIERDALPKDYQAAIVSRIKVMGNMDIAEKRLPQDGRIQLDLNGRSVDLRVSTFPTVYGENVVIRILDKSRALQPLEDVGLSPETLARYQKLIAKPYGMILVTGPTGSGKTTSLYATLNRLDHSEKNIMTLEDPVEYELDGVRQSQVNIKAGLTFVSGLRSLVRQDPDIILIGEIRDQETADIAIHASLTGHLVFSTLHTNDASSAASRLTDMGVEPFLVATSLMGVVAQRLIRVLCDDCKEPYMPPEPVIERLGLTPEQATKIFKEVGCSKCRNTGYTGRNGAFELLIINEPLRRLITQRAAADEIRTEAIKQGMTTLRQDGIDKLIQGITSVSEVLRSTGEE